MVLAFSLQAQVEKYGAYVGIAAFFGLAVLTLLYFSQARELKRLREWAGRAPERASELEQRVVTQATAAVSRRPATTSLPQRPAPPRRLAEMPAPAPGAAAQAASGGQATELAEAAPADPVTNGNVPSGSVPVGPQPANRAAPPADAVEPNGDAAGEDEEGEQAATPEGAGAPETAAAAGPPVAAETPAAPETAAAAGAPVAAETPAAPGSAEAAATPSAADGPASPPDAPAVEPSAADAAVRPPVEPDPDDTDEEESAAAAVPRATPVQRPPAPMPLRQSQPSAAPRRPAQAATRRPAKPPREGRSAGTIALLVGLGVLVLGGGAFAASQLGGDDTPTKPNRPEQPASQSPVPTAGQDGGSLGTSTTPAAETNVAVLNGTTFNGLARQIQDKVAAQGFQRGRIATNPDQSVQASTAYYADGFRTQARRVARLVGVSVVKPLDAATQAQAPQANVVVVAGADKASP